MKAVVRITAVQEVFTCQFPRQFKVFVLGCLCGSLTAAGPPSFLSLSPNSLLHFWLGVHVTVIVVGPHVFQSLSPSLLLE